MEEERGPPEGDEHGDEHGDGAPVGGSAFADAVELCQSQRLVDEGHDAPSRGGQQDGREQEEGGEDGGA